MTIMTSTISLLLTTYVLASCTTPGQKITASRSVKPASVPTACDGPKTVDPKTSSLQIPRGIAIDAEYAAFFARLVLPENNYTETDRQILVKIPPAPSAGTIHEAALAVGLLRDVLTPIGTSLGAPGIDGISPPTKSLHTAASHFSRVIEIRSQEMGLDMIGAISSNPYLKNRHVYQMTYNTLLLGGNSPIFTKNMLAMLRQETSSWEAFANKLVSNNGTSTDDHILKPEMTVEADQDDKSQPTTVEQNESSQTDGETSEISSYATQLLTTAQELAAKDQIEKAITTAKMIPENSEAYTVALQNIKIWSDRASQNLRKQAAQQYRASSSTPDATGKKVYLSKAQTLLEEAISKYPDSSNLDTIKENLEIINKELNNLD
jgi:hypothetical protein